jgi:hypothetical protein
VYPEGNSSLLVNAKPLHATEDWSVLLDATRTRVTEGASDLWNSVFEPERFLDTLVGHVKKTLLPQQDQALDSEIVHELHHYEVDARNKSRKVPVFRPVYVSFPLDMRLSNRSERGRDVALPHNRFDNACFHFCRLNNPEEARV